MKKYVLVASLLVLTSACGKTKFAGENKSGNDASKGTSDATPVPDIKPVEEPTGSDDPFIPETTSEGISNDPSTNTVVFGGSGVYRVGDGRASDTSCKQSVFGYELEGSSYSFLFNVEQDDTSVSFQIGRLCGIDYEESNSFGVRNLDTNAKVESIIFDRIVVDDGGAPLAPFKSQLVLKKGRYAIQVISNPQSGRGSDRDDFIIGNIRLKGNKPIRGTEIETD